MSSAQISFMEADMEEDRRNILCTKVDPHAGNWPSDAFIELFHIAKKCVEARLKHRPEIAAVISGFIISVHTVHYSGMTYRFTVYSRTTYPDCCIQQNDIS
jgi:hypothetical protein